MINLTVTVSGFQGLANGAASKQIRFAAARALNDCAMAASVAVNRAMPSVFDRPTAFTSNAAVAPKSLAAKRDHLSATVTVRDRQAQYLAVEEAGGTRTPSTNTRKPGATALILPGKALALDAYGNIPAGYLRKLQAMAALTARASAAKGKRRGQMTANGKGVVYLPASAPGNLAHIGGFFMRTGSGHLSRLTAFEAQTHYRPRLGYHARVQATVAATWAPAMRQRYAQAMATARP